jgi:hypothetical protein
MAIVTRWFSTTGAGDESGDSWANRAALFTGGAWSTVITGFAFTAGADSLLCLVGPGTHAITAVLQSASFSAGAPTDAKPIFFHGCDSSGDPLVPPAPNWTSAEPVTWRTDLPVLATTTNTATISLAHAFVRMLRFTASGITSAGAPVALCNADWVSVDVSSSHASAGGFSTMEKITNCEVVMGGTTYGQGVYFVNCMIDNLRVEGNPSASTGSPKGLYSGGVGAELVLSRCTVFNHVGAGVAVFGSNVAYRFSVINSVIANNGGDGIVLPALDSQTSQHAVSGCMITGNGGIGINPQNDDDTGAKCLIMNNRLRDNTGGNIDSEGNYPATFDNYTTDDSDANEYVDAAGGDFRIRPTSATWGKGYGVKDKKAQGRRRAYLV